MVNSASQVNGKGSGIKVEFNLKKNFILYFLLAAF